MQVNRGCLARLSILAITAMLMFASLAGNAQTTNATLTGTVFDSSGAVVPKANVILTNESSGDLRRTVSNSDGYFTFAAVPPASYTIRVEMAGFAAWETTSVVLNASDKRNVSGIKLTPGAAKETITVEATAAQITPIDSGEEVEPYHREDPAERRHSRPERRGIRQDHARHGDDGRSA